MCLEKDPDRRYDSAKSLNYDLDVLRDEVVSGEPGSDPAAVAYDAYRMAADSGADVVLVDTAGRLHSKTNLMDELGKVARVLRREAGQIGEVLLVLDGTTGQNGIEQARSFTESVGVTGIVLTKLDGTARGGGVIAGVLLGHDGKPVAQACSAWKMDVKSNMATSGCP